MFLHSFRNDIVGEEINWKERGADLKVKTTTVHGEKGLIIDRKWTSFNRTR